MEKVFSYAGIAGFTAGVFLLIYQGITYLMHNAWTQYTLIFLVNHGPGSLRAQVETNPQLARYLEACPLFLFLIVIGLLLMFIGSRLDSRYTG